MKLLTPRVSISIRQISRVVPDFKCGLHLIRFHQLLGNQARAVLEGCESGGYI
jgi:hypothetical protein